MTVTTSTKSRSRGGATQLVAIISWVGAAAIVAAAVVYGLIEQRITVDEPPPWTADSSPEAIAENMERHYAWLATTLPQERLAAALLLVGLLSAAVVVVRSAARLPESPLRQLGVLATFAGLAGWAWSEVALVGSHRAVELMAASGNPIETVNAIAFSGDTQATYGQGFASVSLGLGLVVLGCAAISSPQGKWVGLTLIVGALLIALGAVKLSDQDELWVQLAVGVIALPVWLVASATVLSRTETTE